MTASGLQYVLITPAKNEETFLELTIRSVINQTVRPLRWIVVSDGSTDRTNEIVDYYTRQHDWIELLKMPPRQSRDFGGKAVCVNTGYAYAKDLGWDIIGSLDADISFGEDYFGFLLEKFAADPRLGIAGTPFSESGETYDYRFSSTDHVSGACQLFRRACFEAIGGYTPAKGGGIDVIAVLTARSKGWRTRTFTDKTCEHHRPMGSANDRYRFSAIFNLGGRQYCLGFHPLWQFCRSIYQMSRRPYIAGGGVLFLGYLWAGLRRSKRSVTPELIAFQRHDQMRRLRKFLGLDRNRAR